MENAENLMFSDNENIWKLIKSWGIFGLIDIVWSSKCEIML